MEQTKQHDVCELSFSLDHRECHYTLSSFRILETLKPDRFEVTMKSKYYDLEKKRIFTERIKEYSAFVDPSAVDTIKGADQFQS